MTFNKEQTFDLLNRERNFAVSIDGIWRYAKGMYIEPLTGNIRVKCIIDGRFVIVPYGKYMDYDGYKDSLMEGEVIRRNVSAFPAPKRKMKAVFQMVDNYGQPLVQPMPPIVELE